jgi:SNF2 family DNA or RNA helicase
MRNYGTLRLEGNDWLLDAEPHVVIRVKRLFGKLNAGAATIKLRNTPDIARDLQWLMERYPLHMVESHRAVLERAASAHTERSQRFAAVLSGKVDARAFDLAIPPRDYQRVAADLALQSGGLLIADDLGIGKTCSAICVLATENARPALVVTLTHLPRQWARELGRFAPRLRVYIPKKAQPYPLPDCDVIVTSYSKLANWAPAYRGKVRTVVYDEIQELRHPDSQKAVAGKEIAEQADIRIGLSATPIHNYGNEFFNVLDILRPGELGTRAEFMQEWCTAPDMRGNASVRDPKAFGAYLRDQGLMIRRTRAEVGRELPALTIALETVQSGDVFEQLEEDGTDVSELARFIVDRDGKSFDQMQARGELDWKLRQATGLAKARYVAEAVRLILESEERVLLYGWHHVVYEAWEAAFTKARVPYVRFTGEESATQKEAALERFKKGDARVLIMSLRSGAGIDGLQHCCRTVVFGELDWSPAVHEQAAGRVSRDGQKEPVVAYYLVSDEGSDPVLQSTLGIKKAQLEGVRNPQDFAMLETVKRDGIVELAKSVLARRRKEKPQLELGQEGAA